MKTLHVSLGVTDIAQSVAYYSTLFGRAPDVDKPGFAKWWLDDPRVNFALTQKPDAPGLHHLGIEVDDENELEPYYTRAEKAGAFREEGETECCYARSQKGWALDPQGVPWEIFKTSDYLHDMPEAEYETIKPGCC